LVFLSVKIYIIYTKMVFHAIITAIDSVGMPHGIGKADLGAINAIVDANSSLARGILGGFINLVC